MTVASPASSKLRCVSCEAAHHAPPGRGRTSGESPPHRLHDHGQAVDRDQAVALIERWNGDRRDLTVTIERLLDRRQGLLERIEEARSRGLSESLTGVEAVVAACQQAVKERLTEALSGGLHLLDGRRLVGEPAAAANLLLSLGAEMPTGITACRSCGLVFRPLRKSSAQQCDICNSGALGPGVQEDHPDGRGYSLGGLFAGTRHMRCCAVCDDLFGADTRTTLYCAAACKQAAARAAKRGEDPRPPARNECKSDEARALVQLWLTRVATRRLEAARTRGEAPDRLSGREVIECAQRQARIRRAERAEYRRL